MQTIQQKRAKFALEKITAATKDHKLNKKEFNSYAAGLPAMIHMSGLGQAAAFYKSKTKSAEHRRLYNLLSEWLTKSGQPYGNKSVGDVKLRNLPYDDLLDGITKENMHRYRLAQAEAQALMDWVKKFSSAYMTE